MMRCTLQAASVISSQYGLVCVTLERELVLLRIPLAIKRYLGMDAQEGVCEHGCEFAPPASYCRNLLPEYLEVLIPGHGTQAIPYCDEIAGAACGAALHHPDFSTHL